ncbi:MAG TPA: hypothetical protein VLF19_12980 [Methylomirabilota bacterium]|nr:hypothetical protein [Methylomirabilota bacterium]
MPFTVDAVPPPWVAAGTGIRVDEAAGVVVLQDGRMDRVGGERRAIVDARPVTISTVRPGTRVVIRAAQAVQLTRPRIYGHRGRAVVRRVYRGAVGFAGDDDGHRNKRADALADRQRSREGYGGEP